MINLLPDNTKMQLKAARANVILLRYMIIMIFAAAFIVLIFAGSYFLLTLSKTSSEQLIAANDTKAQQFSSTQAEMASLSDNLAGAKNVLDQQVSYSSFLRLLGQVMPSGTVIDSITLNDSTWGGSPVELKIYAISTAATVSLREQFQRNPTFSNVNIDSISEADGISGYPVSATLSLNVNRTAL